MITAPEIDPNWALFLDLDGTLLDIAPEPDRVVMPNGLSDTLKALRAALGGALAIVSGRRLGEIDHIVGPLHLPGAGEHGAVVRYASGQTEEIPPSQRTPESWAGELRDRTRDWHGVLIEEKIYSIALHFRLAPDRKDDVRDVALSLVQREPDRFELADAKEALEIRPRGVTKGRAVMLLMGSDSFRERVPVFVGDDVTDEDGIAMAEQLGGFGLRVSSDFHGNPSAVREWLRRAADSLNQGATEHVHP